MKIISAILFLYLLLLSPIFANDWPTFFYPDRQLLMDLNYFDNTGCTWNNVRLKPNSVVNISRYVCEEYCPPDWQWVAKSDGQCHSLSELGFKGYKVDYDNDRHFSKVIAVYGARSSNEIYFEYEMQTAPGEYWYCTLFKDKMEYVVCANDT